MPVAGRRQTERVHPRDLLLLPRRGRRAAEGRRPRRRRRGGALLAQEARLRLPDATPSQFCLEEAGITADDLDYVVFYEKPLPKFERLLTTALATWPHSTVVFREAMITWLNEKLWIKDRIQPPGGRPAEKDPVRRAPPLARRQRLLLLAVRGVGRPDHRRRRRVDHRDARAAARRPGTAAARTSIDAVPGVALPALARPATTRRSPPGSASRSTTASTRSWAWRPYGSPEPPGQGPQGHQLRGRRQLLAEHGLLQLPPLDGAHVQPQVRGAVRRAAQDASPSSSPTGPACPDGASTRRHRGEPVLRRRRRQRPAHDRRGDHQHRQLPAPADRLEAALHGRRRGVQQRRQRPHPARDALRGALHPARRPATPAARSARRSTPTTCCSASRARS